MTPDRTPVPARTKLAIATGSMVSTASRLTGRGRGQVIGGRAILRVDPNAIRRLTAGKEVTLVSATNGKSTTTRFIAEALRIKGKVAHNATGANMAHGVITALAENRNAGQAALEVDEAHLPAILRATRADVVVLMNLSRDQLDRSMEVKSLAERWRKMLAIVDWNCTVVANADDPLVAWAAKVAPRVVWVSCGQWWQEDSELCPSCLAPLQRQGIRWFCASCGMERPRPTWFVDGAYICGPGAVRVRPHLALPGRVNVGNAAIAAAAVACHGVDAATAVAAFARVQDVDGRYVNAHAADHEVRLLLGKNPASWTELIDIVRTDGRMLVIALNARGADGRDPSWLWDVPFENLAGIPVGVAGERRFDMAVRLDVAGLKVRTVALDPLEIVAALPPGPVDVVANYTAFQDLRVRVTR